MFLSPRIVAEWTDEPDAERDEILAEVAEAFRTPRPDWFLRCPALLSNAPSTKPNCRPKRLRRCAVRFWAMALGPGRFHQES
jgi:hypothetical protein